MYRLGGAHLVQAELEQAGGYPQQAFEILKEVDSPRAEPIGQMLKALEAA